MNEKEVKMRVDEVYFWFHEYNDRDECYCVLADYEDVQEYLLVCIKVGMKDNPDMWRISYRYLQENADSFIKVESDDHYRELVKKRKERWS